MAQLPETGGYIMTHQASWFTDERPAEINDFFGTRLIPKSIPFHRKMDQLQKADLHSCCSILFAGVLLDGRFL